jgi:hypothetical protein
MDAVNELILLDRTERMADDGHLALGSERHCACHAGRTLGQWNIVTHQV